MSNPLRTMKRRNGFARRKIADAAAWAIYVEAERRAGRVPMEKRTWRAKRPDLQAARSQSIETQSPEAALRAGL